MKFPQPRALSFTPRRLPSSLPLPLVHRRSLHTPLPVSSLPFNLSQGVPPFLTPQAAHRLAVEWQTGLLDNLNQHVVGTEAEGMSLFDTIVELSKERTQVVPFNLASEALNNSFFLNGLRKIDGSTGRNAPPPGSTLHRHIEQTYGSVTQLISYFSSAAMGMFSSGYVWLVCDQDAQLGVCATYGGGTILVQNRQQQGDWGNLLAPSPNTNTNATPSDSPASPSNPTQSTAKLANSLDGMFGVSTPRGFSTSARAMADESNGKAHGASFTDALFTSAPSQSFFPPVNAIRGSRTKAASAETRFSQVYPLLALQVAERCWVPEYGVWGKEEYVKRFWGRWIGVGLGASLRGGFRGRLGRRVLEGIKVDILVDGGMQWLS